uniref:Uncharacterized protein n=1 Tax=Ciona savignyi TaxID=51511 RepID=H2YV98_CIOSA
MNGASNSPNPSKRKRDISNLTSTPGKRFFCDDSQSGTQMSQDEDNVAVASSQSTCATGLNTCWLFGNINFLCYIDKDIKDLFLFLKNLLIK